MLDVWLGGLITQVTSLPACVRIERWLHQEYPPLRNEQRLYLDEDVQRTLQGLSKKLERVTPKTLFRISNSITYAYLRGLEPVTGKDFRKHFSGRRPSSRPESSSTTHWEKKTWVMPVTFGLPTSGQGLLK